MLVQVPPVNRQVYDIFASSVRPSKSTFHSRSSRTKRLRASSADHAATPIWRGALAGLTANHPPSSRPSNTGSICSNPTVDTILRPPVVVSVSGRIVQERKKSISHYGTTAYGDTWYHGGRVLAIRRPVRIFGAWTRNTT